MSQSRFETTFSIARSKLHLSLTSKDTQMIENNINRINSLQSGKEKGNTLPPIGRIIEEELKRQHKSVIWLSKQINCDRRNVYDIFHRDTIDTSLLLRISVVLNVDFFKIYSDYIVKLLKVSYLPPP